MSANLQNPEGLVADIMTSADHARETAARSEARAVDASTTDPAVIEDASRTELYELLALMHVPTREIIDPDERNGYENYLAQHARNR